MSSHVEHKQQRNDVQEKSDLEKAQRESVDVLLDIPDSAQAKILRELTALYYALLGPQTILEASSNVSRPPFPLGYKDTDDRPRFMPASIKRN